MFRKFFKNVAEKLFNTGKKQPTQKVQPKPQEEIPRIKSEDAPRHYQKPNTRNIGRNLAKRHLAIRALGKTRKQLREMGLHIRPKVARIRASRMVA